jgi:hypothetical protein
LVGLLVTVVVRGRPVAWHESGTPGDLRWNRGGKDWRVPELPRAHEDCALVVRTDFGSEPAWARLKAVLETPADDGHGGFAAVDFVDDVAFAGMGSDAVRALVPDGDVAKILVIADAEALASAEHPLLVVDLVDRPGRCLRIVASELWGLQGDLAIANQDLDDYVAAADQDGVFRGF